jgi:hypothetical protein
MLTAGAAKAAAVKETTVAAEKAAATTAEEAAAAGRQQQDQRIRTKGMLEMRAVKQDRKKTAEKAEDKAERLRKMLVESIW